MVCKWTGHFSAGTKDRAAWCHTITSNKIFLHPESSPTELLDLESTLCQLYYSLLAFLLSVKYRKRHSPDGSWNLSEFQS